MEIMVHNSHKYSTSDFVVQHPYTSACTSAKLSTTAIVLYRIVLMFVKITKLSHHFVKLIVRIIRVIS